jgi:hypothetical protein
VPGEITDVKLPEVDLVELERSLLVATPTNHCDLLRHLPAKLVAPAAGNAKGLLITAFPH